MRYVALAVLAMLAGCLDAEPGIQYQDDVIAVDQPRLPDAPATPAERTLQEAPVWRLGEWWKVRLTDHFTGESREFMRVVAGTERGNYLVGFPIEGFDDGVLVMHFPGFGDIAQADLSYEAHDYRFHPVKFPLEPGQTWETEWMNSKDDGGLLTALVESVEGERATITMGGAQNLTLVYDADMGEVIYFRAPGYETYEVIDHGYHYNGDVRVPHAHDLIFFDGRIAGIGDFPGPFPPLAPAAPSETITVPGGYDRLAFALILFDITGNITQNNGQDAAAGAYRIAATAPDGTVYEEMLTPADQFWMKMTSYLHDGPEGDWVLETHAGGFGAAFAEGIGYHSIDVTLPEGCVLASENAAHHAGRC